MAGFIAGLAFIIRIVGGLAGIGLFFTSFVLLFMNGMNDFLPVLGLAFAVGIGTNVVGGLMMKAAVGGEVV